MHFRKNCSNGSRDNEWLYSRAKSFQFSQWMEKVGRIPALLSYYEMVARNPTTLDLALWKDSSTAKNLRASAKITIMISDTDLNYYLKGTVQELQYEMAGAPQVSRFRVTL